MFDKDPKENLKKILIESARKNTHMGSSTCVLLKFDDVRENTIKTTNLGDSGYIILWPSPKNCSSLEIIYKSSEQ